jgi:hypothetical protein
MANKRKKTSPNTSRDDGAGSSNDPTILDLYNLMKEQSQQLQQLRQDNETLSTRLLAIDEKLTVSQKEIQNLKLENQGLKKNVSALQLDVVELKQEQLSNNLVISGTGVIQEGKTPFDNLLKIVKDLDGDLESNDVSDVYHIRRRSGVQLVVKFNRAQHKVEMMEKMKTQRRDAQSSGAQFPLASVFFNDHLSPFYENLWYKCRVLKKKTTLKYAWTKMGKLYVKKEEGGAVIRIRNTDDLLQLYTDYDLEI